MFLLLTGDLFSKYDPQNLANLVLLSDSSVDFATFLLLSTSLRQDCSVKSDVRLNSILPYLAESSTSNDLMLLLLAQTMAKDAVKMENVFPFLLLNDLESGIEIKKLIKSPY